MRILKRVSATVLGLGLVFGMVAPHDLSAQSITRQVIGNGATMIFDGSGNLTLGGTVGQTIVGVGGYEPGALDIYHGFWYMPQSASSVNDPLNPVAGERSLWNTPNPFTSQTTIHFDIPQHSEVKVRVYDMEGKLVATVANGRYLKGSHEVAWDAIDAEGNRVSTGYYYYTLDAQPSNGSGTPITRQAKMLVMK